MSHVINVPDVEHPTLCYAMVDVKPGEPRTLVQMLRCTIKKGHVSAAGKPTPHSWERGLR